MSIRIIMFLLSKVKCHFFLLEIGPIGSWRNQVYGFLENIKIHWNLVNVKDA